MEKQLCIMAAERYLKQKGFYTLDIDFRCDGGSVDVIAMNSDENVITFVKVFGKEMDGSKNPFDGLSGSEGVTKEEFESVAVDFLLRNADLSDCEVEFGLIDIVKVNAERALIRHHRNFS